MFDTVALVNSVVGGLVAAALMFVWDHSRRRVQMWRSKSPLRARLMTHEVIASHTADLAGVQLNGMNIGRLWQVDYDLRNASHDATAKNVRVKWKLQGEAKIATMFTFGEGFRIENESQSQVVRAASLGPKQKTSLTFYVDANKKPQLTFSTTSSVGKPVSEVPILPSSDVIPVVIGIFAAVQTLITMIEGYALVSAIFGVLTGLSFGAPFTFGLVRRLRDEGSLDPYLYS